MKKILALALLLFAGQLQAQQTQVIVNPEPSTLLLDQSTGQYVHPQTGQRFYLQPISKTVPQAAPASTLASHPALAEVRIGSHGASGTVIATMPGRSWILSCGHAFTDNQERPSSASRNKPIKLDGYPQPNAPQKLANARLLDVDYEHDLSLIVIDNGPFHFIPVAPPGFRPGNNVVSTGFDELRWPPQYKPATILKTDSTTTWTREMPWHGRSGGGLIDADAKVLIGVVHGYEVEQPKRGLYVSHKAVLAFLARNQRHFQGAPIATSPAPQIAPKAAYLDIAPANRIPNRTGSQCVWSSLETLARQHGITQLYNLTSNHRGLSGPGEVESLLRSRQVRFKQTTQGSMEFLRAAQGYGCLIGLDGQHAVVCADVSADKVYILDNMDSELKIRAWSMEKFRSRWDGWAVVIYPNGSDGAQIRPQYQPQDIHRQMFDAAPCPS